MTYGTNQGKEIVLVLLSTVLFASYGVWSRLLGPRIPNFFGGYVRSLMVAIPLVAVMWWRKETFAINRADRNWWSIYLLFTSATQAPLYYAFNEMDIGSATLLFYVSFLVTMYVIGYVFLGEDLGLVKLVSFLSALVGLCAIFTFSVERSSLLAAAMAVLNGIASGGEVGFSKKLSSRYSSMHLITFSWLCIAATSLPISLALGEQQLVPALTMPWLHLVCFSLASLGGFWILIVGVRHLDASLGGLLGLLEIIFSIVFGIVLFNEEIAPRIVTGGVFILTAIMLPHLAQVLSVSRMEIKAREPVAG